MVSLRMWVTSWLVHRMALPRRNMGMESRVTGAVMVWPPSYSRMKSFMSYHLLPAGR